MRFHTASVGAELTANLGAWYMWEGIDRWVLQALLVEVLSMGMVCRGLASALVANE